LLKKLDEEITGEQRYDFIKRFFLTGWVYESSDNIEGAYLPGLGSGLIFAKNQDAGLELLKFKLSTSKTRIVIPSENKIALDFLKNEGYQSFSTAPRMFLGNEVNWKPELVFSRATGYSG
jgi:Acetyltransferase (GNAT) domain